MNNLVVAYAVRVIALFAENHTLSTAAAQAISVHCTISYVFWWGGLKIGTLAATWEQRVLPIG